MPRKIPIYLYISMLVAVSLAALWFSTESLISAQEEPLPIPNSTADAPETEPTHSDGPSVEMSEEEQQQQDMAIATAQAEFESRSIFDYRVAYLIEAEVEVTNQIVDSQNINEFTGAEVFHVWEDFLRVNEEQSFQIVLVHISMLEQIDLEWTHEAYRNNTILIGINFSHDELSMMTGDACLKDMNPQIKVSDYTASFRYFLYSVMADENLFETIHQATLINCTDYDADGATTGVTHGQYQYRLEEQLHLNALIGSLITTTMSYGLPNPNSEASIR